MNPLARERFTRLACLGAGVVLFLAAAHAAKPGWADLDASAARALFERWEREQDPGLAQDWWQRGEDLLRRARALAPRNADYTFAQGLWHGRRAEREEAAPAVVPGYRGSADALFRDSLTRRSTWAYAWSQRAVSRYASQGFDLPTLRSLHRSLEWGPWEPDVLRNAAWLSMQAWDQFPPDLQLRAWDAILRAAAMPSVRRDLTELARRFGWTVHLESMMQRGEPDSEPRRAAPPARH